MAAVFQLDVLAASVPFFQGKCVSAVIPVTDGEYGVLASQRMPASGKLYWKLLVERKRNCCMQRMNLMHGQKI